MKSTPFAHWLENGEEQPYGGDYESTSHIDLNEYREVVGMLRVIDFAGFQKVAWLTKGKELLRRLSRKLYRMVDDVDSYSKHRASMANGEMTDDELANAFYLSETRKDCEAGADRIVWLYGEIEKLKR